MKYRSTTTKKNPLWQHTILQYLMYIFYEYKMLINNTNKKVFCYLDLILTMRF